ncbi:hypothetical protein NDU88_004655 [Pleurodeles waltl]|uniref:Protein MGARP N-terminal domain-containing protein n=1 Tax=Pleurodeles waltl TaxID=8319 RepID=A0AAV7WWB3_PLEWA|nr:hypothetical protein NDU88_004655 [Pleurodeles waltl]
MSSSSVPGSSGQGMIYYVFVGVAAAGGGFYLYRTLSRDKTRFHERAAYLENRTKESDSKIGTSKREEDAEIFETPEVSELIEETTTVEAVAVVTEVASNNKSYKEANYTEEDKASVDGIHLSADEEVAPQEENTTLEEAHAQEAKVEVLEGEVFSAPGDAPHSSEKEITGDKVSDVSIQSTNAASEQEMPADNEMASTRLTQKMLSSSQKLHQISDVKLLRSSTWSMCNFKSKDQTLSLHLPSVHRVKRHLPCLKLFVKTT